MKNAIISCSDDNCGDFLTKHWLPSLLKNVDLKNIDIIVVDYGMTENQKQILKKNKVILFPGIKDCAIVVARCRDMAKLLTEKNMIKFYCVMKEIYSFKMIYLMYSKKIKKSLKEFVNIMLHRLKNCIPVKYLMQRQLKKS